MSIQQHTVFENARVACEYYNSVCHPANKVSRETFCRWLRRGWIVAIRSKEGRGGAAWWVAKSDIDDAIKNWTVYPYSRRRKS
jgi:hypothetical protein